jgi:hypothetical protein
MKLEPFRHPSNPGQRKPLRTAKELAAEFGLTMAQLRGHLGAAGAPKPEVVHHNNSHYDQAKFRAWFRREVMA